MKIEKNPPFTYFPNRKGKLIKKINKNGLILRGNGFLIIF